MNTQASATILDLDSLLDSTLDGVEDIADYINPPTGLYQLSIIEAEIKAGKKADPAKKQAAKAARIVITYKVEATTETEGIPVPDGTLFTEGMQGTEDGLKFFKKQARKLLNVDSLDGVSIRDILGSLKEIGLFDARIVLKETPGDNGRTYENVNVTPIWPEATA